MDTKTRSDGIWPWPFTLTQPLETLANKGITVTYWFLHYMTRCNQYSYMHVFSSKHFSYINSSLFFFSCTTIARKAKGGGGAKCTAKAVHKSSAWSKHVYRFGPSDIFIKFIDKVSSLEHFDIFIDLGLFGVSWDLDL